MLRWKKTAFLSVESQGRLIESLEDFSKILLVFLESSTDDYYYYYYYLLFRLPNATSSKTYKLLR